MGPAVPLPQRLRVLRELYDIVAAKRLEDVSVCMCVFTVLRLSWLYRGIVCSPGAMAGSEGPTGLESTS